MLVILEVIILVVLEGPACVMDNIESRSCRGGLQEAGVNDIDD